MHAVSKRITRTTSDRKEMMLSLLMVVILSLVCGWALYLSWGAWQDRTRTSMVQGKMAQLSQVSAHVKPQIVYAADQGEGQLKDLKAGIRFGEMILAEIGVQDKKIPISSRNILARFTGEVVLDAAYEYDKERGVVRISDMTLDSYMKLPMVPGIKNPTGIDIKLTKSAEEVLGFVKKEPKGRAELVIRQYLIDGMSDELSIRALVKEVVQHRAETK